MIQHVKFSQSRRVVVFLHDAGLGNPQVMYGSWKNPNLKWMITGGTPILGNPYIHTII